jgi:hypothetical protein
MDRHSQKCADIDAHKDEEKGRVDKCAREAYELGTRNHQQVADILALQSKRTVIRHKIENTLRRN